MSSQARPHQRYIFCVDSIGEKDDALRSRDEAMVYVLRGPLVRESQKIQAEVLMSTESIALT